jgi:hypothetical protein
MINFRLKTKDLLDFGSLQMHISSTKSRQKQHPFGHFGAKASFLRRELRSGILRFARKAAVAHPSDDSFVMIGVSRF